MTSVYPHYPFGTRTYSNSSEQKLSELTHVNDSGKARMVSISHKSVSNRIAVAQGQIKVSTAALTLVQKNQVKKGDVLAVARIAAIMAAKQTSTLIPLCHNIPISKVDIKADIDVEACVILLESTVETNGQTGVEMEALTACTTGLLTIYDMLKAVDKHMVISQVRVISKTGGKSDWNLAAPRTSCS